MKKKIYLIHGWSGSSKLGWFPFLKRLLEQKGFYVVAFDMPNTDKPKIEEWINFLEKNVKDLSDKTFFIAHSIGCQTVLRYLENKNVNKKIGGCIFVAGWFNLKPESAESEEEIQIATPWVETPINCEKIKNLCNNFLCFFSDNDPYVLVSDTDLFRKRLNAKIILEKNKGHYDSYEDLNLQKVLEFLN